MKKVLVTIGRQYGSGGHEIGERMAGILGIPFYARVWTESNGQVDKIAVNMEDLEAYIPEGVEKTWDDNLKQYYVEYTQNGVTTKIWLEDEESIKAKLSLIEEYNLAGAAYWEKDREPDSIWSVISEELGIE